MVKLVKFRVKNYKSIKDSGDCYLTNGITVLAGKNESGKTSILESLEDFDTEKEIRKEAIPIHNNELKPEITVMFSIGKEEMEGIHSGLNIPEKQIDIVVVKNSENQYSILNSDKLFAKSIKGNQKRIKEFEKILNKIKKILEPREIPLDLELLNDDNFSEVSSKISTLKQNLEPHFPRLDEKEKEIIEQTIESLQQIINNYIDPTKIEAEFLEEFKKYIPNFILFDTYDDQIPNKIQIPQLKDDPFINDLAAISDIDLDLIQNPERVRENLKHKDKVNVKVSEEYQKFWEQDAANLYLDWDKENLYFWIKEDGEYYEPKQRSKGRQWHLAFYVRVTARSREDIPNVILIDEPGLFLHARAQKDILKKLEENSENIPIIFSTHSPYLIDPNNLNRVRLIEKNKSDGTKISKVHAKADKETLTPILTAIGEDISQGIRVDIKNSFVVEGISDYYYIHAFKKLIGFNKDINLVPGCGDNIPAVASVLFGWGLDPYFILDSDNPKLVNRLKTKLSICDDVIIKVLDEKGTIEEIFSIEDFKKFILEDENTDISKGIMKYIKDKGLSKELLARKFLERVDTKEITKESLSQDTTKKIEALFQKIEGLLNNGDT